MIFHLVLNPDALIGCRLIPACLVQISRRCEKRRDGGKKKKSGRCRRGRLLSRFCRGFLFWGERATGATRVGACRRCEKTTLFLRTGTHVLSRSPGSRDERALRAPLKAPLIRSRDPPPLPLLLNCRCSSLSVSVLSLSVFLSRASSRPRQLPTPYLFLSFSLFLPFHLVLISYLSQNSISALSHCLPWLHLRTSSFSFYTPFGALFSLAKFYPLRCCRSHIHSISGNFKLTSNDGGNWSIANFCGRKNEFS